MSVKLLAEHHLEFLSLKGGCRDSSESTHVKMPNCWKSHTQAHFSLNTKCVCGSRQGESGSRPPFENHTWL